MRREALLAGGIVVVLGGTLLTAGLVPESLAQPTEDVRPTRVDIRETTIATDRVGGATATLTVDTYLGHRGGPAENLTVVYRAVDLDTGLVATTVRREVGTVAGEGEVRVTGNVTVERQGGYRIETVVYEDGQRRAVGRTEVRGVEALTPAYARTPIRFHEFGGRSDIPTVQYSVADVAVNRTTLSVSTYLTNVGDERAGGLRVVVTARQADSNIVADRATMAVDGVGPGETVAPSAELTVPSGYNYYLDAVLYADGVIVGTAQSAANLDPTETLRVNETRREVGLAVGDFERDGGERREAGVPTEPAGTADAAGPGFGAVAAVVALLVALVAGRWLA